MWSPDRPRWRIGMSSHQLVRTRGRLGWLARDLVFDSVAVEPVSQDMPWRAAVDALARWLGAANTRPPLVQIVLSGSFLRWQLLDWRAELSGQQEMAAYAKLRFADTFGKPADAWQILHAMQPPGRPTPACAAEVALLQALQGACREAGARLDLVVPYFASAADHWRSKLGKGTTWFGLIEPDWLSLGLLHQGSWQALRAQRIDGDLHSVLPGLMTRMAVSAGGLRSPAQIYLAGASVSPASLADLPFEWLRPAGAAGAGTDARRLALGI